MSWAGDFVSDPWGTTEDTVKGVWEDPGGTLKNAASTFTAGYFGLEYLYDEYNEAGDSSYSNIKRLAGLNAQFIEMEAAETKRRSVLQHEDLVKQVIGIQASSGFLAAAGTSKDYVKKMEQSFGQELDYMDKAIASQVEITLLEGEVQAEIAKDQAQAGQLGTVTDVVGLFI